MQRVHDLDGDVFAMPRYIFGERPSMRGGTRRHGQRLAVPPAVGDVIANTRSSTNVWCVDMADVWADPPFLRVVEVERSDDGSWTIRVEDDEVWFRTGPTPDGPPPTGRPLNEEAA